MAARRLSAASLPVLAAVVLAAAGCTTSPTAGDGQDAAIALLAFSPDGRVIATARRSAGTITLLDAGTLARQRELAGVTTAPVRALGFSRDGARIVATGIDDTVVVWDVATGRELFRRAELKGARQAALAPDGTLVAVAGPGREASVWRIEDQRELARFKGHFDEVLAVTFSHRGDLVATGSADRTVRLWTLERHDPVTLPEWHTAAVDGLVFSPDDSLLAASGGELRLWRVADRRSISHAVEPTPGPASPKATQDALRVLLSIIATAASMRQGGAPVYVGPGIGVPEPGYLAGRFPVTFSPDGRLLAVLRSAPGTWGKNEVVIAEISGNRVTRFTCECNTIAFRPDGKVLATAGLAVNFRDAETGAALARPIERTPAASPPGAAKPNIDGVVK